jgi:hypothetical protein
MACHNSNKPFEWTYHHQLSASPPQTPCLPLKASVGERLANLISDQISPRLMPKNEIHSFPVQAVEESIVFVQKHSWHGAAIGA